MAWKVWKIFFNLMQTNIDKIKSKQFWYWRTRAEALFGGREVKTPPSRELEFSKLHSILFILLISRTRRRLNSRQSGSPSTEVDIANQNWGSFSAVVRWKLHRRWVGVSFIQNLLLIGQLNKTEINFRLSWGENPTLARAGVFKTHDQLSWSYQTPSSFG